MDSLVSEAPHKKQEFLDHEHSSECVMVLEESLFGAR